MSGRAAVIFVAGALLVWLVMPRAIPVSADAEAVRQAEKQLTQASAQGNVHALGQMLASDFIATDAKGNRENRTQVLDGFRATPWRVKSLRQENVQIRFYGPTAVVTGVDRVTAHNAAGLDRNVSYPFVHVFRKRGGQWVLIAGRGSLLPVS